MDRISVRSSDVLLARRKLLLISDSVGLILGSALVLLLGAASPAAAQLGIPNPNNPVFIIRPVPHGPYTVVPPGTPGSRETIPFSDEPHRFDNGHPMLPNAGLGYALRQVWIPPRPVVIEAYVPAVAEYRTRYAEIPGFYVMETTTGYLYPERWTISRLNLGVYKWTKAPEQFVPR